MAARPPAGTAGDWGSGCGAGWSSGSVTASEGDEDSGDQAGHRVRGRGWAVAEGAGSPAPRPSGEPHPARRAAQSAVAAAAGPAGTDLRAVLGGQDMGLPTLCTEHHKNRDIL
ncbi:hypothetical protein GCM10018987_36670 [Streptomyces cremeus]